MPKVRDSLDGKNLEVVLMELGVRFHRVLLDHFSQFVYTSSGTFCMKLYITFSLIILYHGVIFHFYIINIFGYFRIVYSYRGDHVVFLKQQSCFSPFSGAMAALFDINEYRHCIKQFQIQLLNRLFSMMYALMDLCIVRPENLKEVCSSEQFVSTIYRQQF